MYEKTMDILYRFLLKQETGNFLAFFLLTMWPQVGHIICLCPVSPFIKLLQYIYLTWRNVVKVQFHACYHRDQVLFTYKEFKLVQNISANMSVKFGDHTF